MGLTNHILSTEDIPPGKKKKKKERKKKEKLMSCIAFYYEIFQSQVSN
jgi:hypothetical protein